MKAVSKQDYGIALKQMNGAIRRLEMYPPGHPAVLKAVEKPFSALQEIFESANHLIISKVEDNIVINGKNVEGTDLLKRLIDEFDNENISSLTFTKSLTKEELGTFLGFFVKPLGKDTGTKSLSEFLKDNGIQSVKVDKLRYELVTEDEVVVKAEIAEGADLKGQITKILKEDPDLLREIFLSKTRGGSGSGKGSGEGSGSESGEGAGRGSGDGSGSDQLKQEMEKHIKALSDEDLLSLLLSSLKRTLKEYVPQNKDSGSTLNQMAELVNNLLQNREKSKLLPQVKKMLSEGGIVKKEHLDFLFEEKWLKSQEVLDELMKMIDMLGSKEVDLEKFMFLWHRVINSKETEIKTYALEKLIPKLDSENKEARNLATNAVEEALRHFIEENAKSDFFRIQDLLYQKIKNQLLPADVFHDYSRLMKIIFPRMIQQQDFDEVKNILIEYNTRLSQKSTCPVEVKKVARDFIREVSDQSTLDILISRIKEGIPFQDIKLTEEILESLDKKETAKKLTEVFTLNDRTTRMSALRVLSRLGKGSLSAFSDLLSGPGAIIREKGTLLEDEQWYKIRNIIYVLGNIPDEESVRILSELSRDQDPRVKLETIKALEKIGNEKAVTVLLNLLEDEDDQVRRRILSSLSTIGDRRCLAPLMKHLQHKQQDMKITLAAIVKIGGEESTDPLLKILREEGIKHLPRRQKDEIKIAVFNLLGEIGSPDLANEIENFVKQRGKGFKTLLVKDKVLESANRTLKAIERKSVSHPVPSN
jgi:HEAT repeat protein